MGREITHDIGSQFTAASHNIQLMALSLCYIQFIIVGSFFTGAPLLKLLAKLFTAHNMQSNTIFRAVAYGMLPYFISNVLEIFPSYDFLINFGNFLPLFTESMDRIHLLGKLYQCCIRRFKSIHLPLLPGIVVAAVNVITARP